MRVRAAVYRWLYPVAVMIHWVMGKRPPRPPFDEGRAAGVVGKYVVIGLTYYDAEGEVLEQRQMHGTIVSAHGDRGIEIALKGHRLGETFRLPPDLRPLQRAASGEYRLRSTGEVIVDPDFTCTWSVTQPRG